MEYEWATTRHLSRSLCYELMVVDLKVLNLKLGKALLLIVGNGFRECFVNI